MVYVVQSGICRPSGQMSLSFSDGSTLVASSAALPSSDTLSHSWGVRTTVWLSGAWPLRIWSASVTPAPPTDPGFVTAAPTRPG